MREIKFRYVCENEVGDFYFQFLKIEEFYNSSFLEHMQPLPYTKVVSVDQFTGLKDLEGVDIYEGDVFIDDGDKWVVEYDDGKYELFNDGEFVSDFFQYMIDYEELVIAGNIHEGVK